MDHYTHLHIEYTNGTVTLPDLLLHLPAVRYLRVPAPENANLRKAAFYLTFIDSLQEQFPYLRLHPSPRFIEWLFRPCGQEELPALNPENPAPPRAVAAAAHLLPGGADFSSPSAIAASISRFYNKFLTVLPDYEKQDRRYAALAPYHTEQASKKNRHEISIVGWGDGVLGIGEDQRTLKKALDAVHLSARSVLAAPLAPHHARPYAWDVPLHAAPEGDCAIICLAAQDIYRLWANSPAAWWRNRRVIGLCPWELPLWPESARHCLEMLDELWAPSAFTACAFAGHGKPVRHIPHAVIPPAPNSNLRVELAIPEEAVVFLAAFDAGASCIRKNPLAVIRAFNRAFSGRSTPARLIIKAMNAKRDPFSWKALHDENRCGEAVVFIDDIFSAQRSAELLNTCDAFVSLHRSEGFGRLLAEAMTLGKLLIASNFGGNTDFTTVETACPVSGRLIDVKPGEYLFSEGQQWFEADIDHAAQCMLDFATNPGAFATLAASGRRHILERHSLEAVGRLVKEALIRAGVLL